jgi:DNA-binding MarR family transcriptional regulator
MYTKSLPQKIEYASHLLGELIPQVIRGVQMDFVAEQNVTNLQLLTLISVSFAPCTMSELAKEMKMSLPRATGIIDRLVKLGLLSRTPDEQDRRVICVALSKKGLELLAGYKQMIQARWKQIFQLLEEKDLDMFLKGVQKIHEKVTAK